MAGYVERHQGYVYQGAVNGTNAPLKDGMIVKMVMQNGVPTFVLPTASTSVKFMAVEKKSIYDNKPGTSFEVINTAGDVLYFIHCERSVDDSGAYDTTQYEIPVGKKAIGHPLLPGETILTDQVTGNINVGTTYGLKATGTIG